MVAYGMEHDAHGNLLRVSFYPQGAFESCKLCNAFRRASHFDIPYWMVVGPGHPSYPTDHLNRRFPL